MSYNEINNNIDRRRLKKGNLVVGYMRIDFPGRKFFSKDGLWWSGRKIDYDKMDLSVGLTDKNKRTIYENDVIFVSQKEIDVYFYAQVTIEDNCVQLLDLENGFVYDFIKDYQFLYKAKEMEIVNHSFKDAAFRDQFPFLSKGEGIFT